MPTKDSLRVEPRVSLRDMTAGRLREAIHQGLLTPNVRLSERDLSDRMGVSRSSIREAIQHLELEGLLFRSKNKGIYVAEITAEQARQIYQIREALEPVVARSFAERATQSDIAEMREALDEIRTATTAGQPYAYVKAHRRYFDTIYSNSGNEIAREILQSLDSRIAYLRMITFEQSTDEHSELSVTLLAEILDAVAAGRQDEVGVKVFQTVTRSAAFCIDVLSE